VFRCAFQLQRLVAAHHGHVGVRRVIRGHLAGHGAGGKAQYPFVSRPNAVGLVHHAVQPKSRLRQHTALHPGGRLPAVSADDKGRGGGACNYSNLGGVNSALPD